MPAGTTNLSTMRVDLAKRMHDYLAGATTAAHSDSYFIDTEGLTEGDNWWTGGWIRITGARIGCTNVNLIKRIREYKQVSQMGRIWGTFNACLAASTSYQLFKLIEPSVYDDACNEASRMCYPQLYRYVENESIIVEANTWTYTVPSLMRDVAEVEYQVSTSEATYPYAELQGCEITEDGKLRIPAVPPVGNKLRLKGMVPLTDSLSSDSDIITVDKERLEPFYWAAEQYLWDYLCKTAPASETERYSRNRGWAYIQWQRSLRQKAMQPPDFKVQASHLESWR